MSIQAEAALAATITAEFERDRRTYRPSDPPIVRDESRAPSPLAHPTTRSVPPFPPHDAIESSSTPATGEVKRRNRSRVKGDQATLSEVVSAQHMLAEALSAASRAREARSAAVKAALDSGWSVRGLAEALGVDKSWVQRVASGTWD